MGFDAIEGFHCGVLGHENMNDNNCINESLERAIPSGSALTRELVLRPQA